MAEFDTFYIKRNNRILACSGWVAEYNWIQEHTCQWCGFYCYHVDNYNCPNCHLYSFLLMHEYDGCDNCRLPPSIPIELEDL